MVSISNLDLVNCDFAGLSENHQFRAELRRLNAGFDILFTNGGDKINHRKKKQQRVFAITDVAVINYTLQPSKVNRVIPFEEVASISYSEECDWFVIHHSSGESDYLIRCHQNKAFIAIVSKRYEEVMFKPLSVVASNEFLVSQKGKKGLSVKIVQKRQINGISYKTTNLVWHERPTALEIEVMRPPTAASAARRVSHSISVVGALDRPAGGGPGSTLFSYGGPPASSSFSVDHAVYNGTRSVDSRNPIQHTPEESRRGSEPSSKPPLPGRKPSAPSTEIAPVVSAEDAAVMKTPPRGPPPSMPRKKSGPLPPKPAKKIGLLPPPKPAKNFGVVVRGNNDEDVSNGVSHESADSTQSDAAHGTTNGIQFDATNVQHRSPSPTPSTRSTSSASHSSRGSFNGALDTGSVGTTDRSASGGPGSTLFSYGGSSTSSSWDSTADSNSSESTTNHQKSTSEPSSLPRKKKMERLLGSGGGLNADSNLDGTSIGALGRSAAAPTFAPVVLPKDAIKKRKPRRPPVKPSGNRSASQPDIMNAQRQPPSPTPSTSSASRGSIGAPDHPAGGGPGSTLFSPTSKSSRSGSIGAPDRPAGGGPGSTLFSSTSKSPRSGSIGAPDRPAGGGPGSTLFSSTSSAPPSSRRSIKDTNFGAPDHPAGGGPGSTLFSSTSSAPQPTRGNVKGGPGANFGAPDRPAGGGPGSTLFSFGAPPASSSWDPPAEDSRPSDAQSHAQERKKSTSSESSTIPRNRKMERLLGGGGGLGADSNLDGTSIGALGRSAAAPTFAPVVLPKDAIKKRKPKRPPQKATIDSGSGFDVMNAEYRPSSPTASVSSASHSSRGSIKDVLDTDVGAPDRPAGGGPGSTLFSYGGPPVSISSSSSWDAPVDNGSPSSRASLQNTQSRSRSTSPAKPRNRKMERLLGSGGGLGADSNLDGSSIGALGRSAAAPTFAPVVLPKDAAKKRKSKLPLPKPKFRDSTSDPGRSPAYQRSGGRSSSVPDPYYSATSTPKVSPSFNQPRSNSISGASQPSAPGGARRGPGNTIFGGTQYSSPTPASPSNAGLASWPRRVVLPKPSQPTTKPTSPFMSANKYSPSTSSTSSSSSSSSPSTLKLAPPQAPSTSTGPGIASWPRRAPPSSSSSSTPSVRPIAPFRASVGANGTVAGTANGTTQPGTFGMKKPTPPHARPRAVSDGIKAFSYHANRAIFEDAHRERSGPFGAHR